MNTTNETVARMIGMKEYAEKHGYNRNTVAYWCQKGMLKGVIKKPEAKSGFAKYIYMIPEDAQPKKRTAESIAAERGLLTAEQYAERMGCNKKTVILWCSAGRLPGAVKAEKGKGFYFWLIPEGAEPTKPYIPKEITREPKPKAEAPKPKKPARPKTEREISLYIRRFCGTRTYRQMAEELGMSTLEIRARYDRLHERDGI